MSMNMNSGYSGWSMSVRAAEARSNGEMPKSKWTKAAIIAAVKACCEEFDLAYSREAEKATKAELFDRFIEYKSWHHTSKFANATDFYGVDEEAVCETFPELPAEEVARREAERRAAAEALRAACEESRKARREARSAEREYLEANGFAHDSLAAYMASHPENCEERTSRKGNRVVEILEEKDLVHAGVYEARRKDNIRLHGFSALNEKED